MNAKAQFRTGYNYGKNIVGSAFDSGASGRSKGQAANLGKWISALFGLLIFSYVASTMGPDIISNFIDTNISGAEGEIFSLGGILAAAGILAGVAGMVGLKIFK